MYRLSLVRISRFGWEKYGEERCVVGLEPELKTGRSGCRMRGDQLEGRRESIQRHFKSFSARS